LREPTLLPIIRAWTSQDHRAKGHLACAYYSLRTDLAVSVRAGLTELGVLLLKAACTVEGDSICDSPVDYLRRCQGRAKKEAVKVTDRRVVVARICLSRWLRSRVWRAASRPMAGLAYGARCQESFHRIV